MVCEYLANDDPSTTAPQQTYVYGSYVDEALMKVDASSVKLYYHANRQYSVTAMTDSSGTVVERYAYSPYGVTTILAPDGATPRATSAVGNTYMYTGRRLDKEFASSSEDAIYYYRARYYTPQQGRFTSRDPLTYVEGMSVYAGYFAALTAVDPNGTKLGPDGRPSCLTSHRDCVNIGSSGCKSNNLKNCSYLCGGTTQVVIQIYCGPGSRDAECEAHIETINQ
jgi:RHS repeat-associated protein